MKTISAQTSAFFEELKRAGKLEAQTSMRNVEEDSRGVSTKCAHVNWEASLVPPWYDLSLVASSSCAFHF